MYDAGMVERRLAHAWNGQWGTMSRKDVRVFGLDDVGRYAVEWTGGEWTDRAGRLTRAGLDDVLAAVRELIAASPGDWRESSVNDRYADPTQDEIEVREAVAAIIAELATKPS
jgi:hypothetical protein